MGEIDVPVFTMLVNVPGNGAASVTYDEELGALFGRRSGSWVGCLL